MADVDCLTQQRVVKGKPSWQVLTTSVQEAVAELQDPDLPVVRGARWIGWRAPSKDDDAEGRLVLDFRGAKEREEFAFRFGFDDATFRGTRYPDEESLRKQREAWAWWCVHERGTALDLGQSMLAPTY